MVKDTLGPVIEKNLARSIPSYKTSIAKYIDKNSEILYTFDLSTRISFGDYDRFVAYEAAGLTEDVVKTEVTKSKIINKSNKVQSNSFYITCMLIMRQCILDKKEDIAQLTMSYMSLMMYTSIHYGFFKFGANKNIMDYTVAHLDNSYRLRSMKSLYAFLEDNAQTAFNTYHDKIKNGDDADLTWVIDALWMRIKGKLKKIANNYYDNHKNGKYLNYDTDSYAEGDYHTMDNNSYMIDRLADKVYLKLINHQFDDRFVKYSITRSDTSYAKLKNLIDDVIGDDDDQTLRKTISAIIEYYMAHSQKSFEYVAKGDFISFMKSTYGSNTEVAQIVLVKANLDKWLDQNMYKYGKANYGKTARQQYKRSVYMFLVFMVNAEAKTSS